MEKREDGINLIRVIGLLFVFGFHFYLYNGYYHQKQIGAAMLFANASRGLFLSCNGLYMMLTGYLKSGKPINRHYYKCLLSVVVSYVLAASVSIPIRHFFLGDPQPFSIWKERFLSFSGVYYGWYIRMYIGLILISPLINIAIKNITDKMQLLWIMVSCIAATSLAPATPYTIFPAYWEIAYPLSYYLIGAVIKKLQPDVKKGICVAVILIMAVGTGSVTLLSTDGKLKDAVKWEFGAIWIMLIGVSIFLLLYRAQLPKRVSCLMRFAARGSFFAYMLSNLMDAWIYELVPAWLNPKYYGLAFLCLTIPSYILMIIVGNGMQKLVDWTLRNISRKRL